MLYTFRIKINIWKTFVQKSCHFGDGILNKWRNARVLILGILDFYRLAKLDIQRLMISDQHNKENVNVLGKATKL
jgi:hypothetical protein